MGTSKGVWGLIQDPDPFWTRYKTSVTGQDRPIRYYSHDFPMDHATMTEMINANPLCSAKRWADLK